MPALLRRIKWQTAEDQEHVDGATQNAQAVASDYPFKTAFFVKIAPPAHNSSRISRAVML